MCVLDARARTDFSLSDRQIRRGFNRFLPTGCPSVEVFRCFGPEAVHSRSPVSWSELKLPWQADFQAQCLDMYQSLPPPEAWIIIEGILQHVVGVCVALERNARYARFDVSMTVRFMTKLCMSLRRVHHHGRRLHCQLAITSCLIP